MKPIIFFCCLFLFLSSIQKVLGQAPPSGTTVGDTSRMIDILHYDRLRLEKPDSANQLIMAAGNVVFRDNATLFYADSVVHNKRLNVVEAFGNVHINDSDTTHTYSQYLIYYIDKKFAVLKKKVKMTDGKATLTTEELDYDTNLKIGNYRNGGKIVTGNTVLTSREAQYFAEFKDVYFRHNVKLKDPAYDLKADSLLYNTNSQISTFIAKTTIEDSSGTKTITSEGFYDMKNRVARLGKRSIIQDKGLTITGNDIAMDDASGQFEAAGNAVLIDTTQGLSVIANNIKADRKTNTFLATLHPLMILKQEKDSIYLTADTLFSGRLSDLEINKQPASQKDTIKTLTYLNSTDSSNRNRYFQAFHHVRIFTDSLQAVSDSLFYSGRDSIFQLFKNPILWASNTQVTGDTIYLYTKNKKAERIYVFENGMIVNKSAENFFNQLRGNTINGLFKEGSIDFMRAQGSAESVYYGRDENNAFAGMNNASGDIIDMYFQDQEPKKVVFRTEVTGAFYPMGQIPEEKKTLRNFQWLENKRPKTRFELFEDILTQNESR